MVQGHQFHVGFFSVSEQRPPGKRCALADPAAGAQPDGYGIVFRTTFYSRLPNDRLTTMQEFLEAQFQSAWEMHSQAVQIDFRRRFDTAAAVAELVLPIWEELDAHELDFKECKTSKVPAIAKFLFYGFFFATALFSLLGELIGDKSSVWPYVLGCALLMIFASLVLGFYSLVPFFVKREIGRLQQLHGSLTIHWASAGIVLSRLWELRGLTRELETLKTKLATVWAGNGSEEDRSRQDFENKQMEIMAHWRIIRIEILERSGGTQIQKSVM